MSLFVFILILAALILVHEFGHFSVAKLFGIKVEEFGIGFPPRLLKVQKEETLYSLNLLFFGGFVKIFGEDAAEGGGNPRSFASKPWLVRAAVIVAGVAMNLVFAWLALSVGYMVGLPSSAEHVGFGEVRDAHTTIVGVVPGSPAQKVGVQSQDTIVSVATARTTLPEPATAGQTQEFIAAHADESLILTVGRAGAEKTFVMRAEAGLIEGRKAVGIQLDDVGILQLPPHLALAQGGIITYRITIATAQGLGTFFSQIARGTANFATVAGPIGIADIGAQAVSEGFAAAVLLTAVISINLALINLIPVPGLDGGRLFIMIIEAIIRRPVPQKLTTVLTLGGMALLIGLMLLVSYHDITKLIG